MRMSRRQFGAAVTALGLAPMGKLFAESKLEPEVLRLSRNGWMPNNEHLPVLLYRNAIEPGKHDAAGTFEMIFERNGWHAQWRNGVYDFHHYHSTAHEVLGFAAGHARLVLGGQSGHEVEVRAGDVAVLPTGTGHCRIEASEDFLVVGAYPPHQRWDICRSAPTAETLDSMRSVKFPASDPVSGAAGPLVLLWRGV